MGKLENYWIPTGNRKRKYKGNTRHFKNDCPYCGSKKKDIVWHMKTYHTKEFRETQEGIKQSLMNGQIGSISSCRFIYGRTN